MDKLQILQHVYSHSLSGTLSGTLSDTVEKTSAPDEQPLRGVGPLLPHQERMVAAMIRHRDRMLHGFMGEDQQAINGKLGILADAAGSGKTRTMLAYLERTHRDTARMTTEWVETSSPYFYSHRIRALDPAYSANLVIVPHSVFQQWQEEIALHSFPFVAIETKRMLRMEDAALSEQMKAAVCVLTTNTCYKWVHQYAIHHGIQWNQVVIDEAATIHFQATDPPFLFQFLWLVSHAWIPLLFKYTPIQVRSLYGLMESLDPAEKAGMDPELVEWCREHFQDPMMTQPQLSSFVKAYLPFMHPARGALVLRTRTADLQKSMGLYPPMVQRVACQPTMSLVSLMQRYQSQGIMHPVVEVDSVPRLFSALHVSVMTMEDYVALYPAMEELIRRKIQEGDCTICLEPCTYPTMVSCCFQLYCGACLLRSMLMRLQHTRCSVCRGTLTLSHLTWIDANPTRTILKSKYETCMDMLSAGAAPSAARYVIYTAYENIFYDMFEALVERGLHAERLENHLFSIRKTMRRYKEGKTTILFVSQEEAIRGLNLSETTHLIFYHEPSSSEKRQLLLDAMQRVGRSTPLQVIHLSSEIEV